MEAFLPFPVDEFVEAVVLYSCTSALPLACTVAVLIASLLDSPGQGI